MAEPGPSGLLTSGLDPETPPSVLTRFAITTLEENLHQATVSASMPLGGMCNPFTGQPSIAGVAILVDDVGGRANFYRRAEGQWTVSSELTVEMSPAAAQSLLAAPDEPVVAHARPLGPAAAPMLAVCTLTHCGAVIGGDGAHRTDLGRTGPPDAARAASGGPNAGNHSGPTDVGRTVTSDGRHIPASTTPRPDDQQPARNRARRRQQCWAGTGRRGRYQPRTGSTLSDRVDQGELPATVPGWGTIPLWGTALRVGRTSAVGDARALSTDGKVAVIARVTGYR